MTIQGVREHKSMDPGWNGTPDHSVMVYNNKATENSPDAALGRGKVGFGKTILIRQVARATTKQ